MKVAFLILFLLSLNNCAFANILVSQGFEESSSDTWNYINNQAETSGQYWWGRSNQPLGSASAQAGTWFWASWDLDNAEHSLTFDNVTLPAGYLHTLSFYYYTNGLNPDTDFSEYCLEFDTGTEWNNWITLTPDTDAWTLVSINIPAYVTIIRLKVASSYDGISKYSHWDSFSVTGSTAPLMAPIIYNTSVAQRTDGSKLVDIYYSLFDANLDLCTVSEILSSDGGTTFAEFPNPANLSGDLGNNIANGSNKHIIWNAGADSINYNSSQFKIKIIADDKTIPDSFVYVEGGAFNNDSTNVAVSSFYIDKYELTQSEYQTVMGSNPSTGYGVGDNYPVYYVTWFNAIEYCNRRSLMEQLAPCYSYSTHGTNPNNWPSGWNTMAGNRINISCDWSANGYRLPTEMEWMFAAKGGILSQGYEYSGSNNINSVAWNIDNAENTSHEVGLKAPNELGTYDMSGNVGELVWDYFGDYPVYDLINPTGPGYGSLLASRGCGWTYDNPGGYTNWIRRALPISYNNYESGFRIIRPIPWVVTPAISHAGGNYDSTCVVTITCATVGARILYTTDGSEPSEISNLYTEPFLISHNLTLKVKAFKDNVGPSATVTEIYWITSQTLTTAPVIAVTSGGAIIISAPEGAEIYYTRDGSIPNPAVLMPFGTTIQYVPAKVNRTVAPICLKAVFIKNGIISAVATMLPEDMIKPLMQYEIADFGGSIVSESALDDEIAYIKANNLYSKIGYLIGKNWGVKTGSDQTTPETRPVKVAFTFDDGFAPQTMNTAARLEAVGAVGTFCINSHFIGRTVGGYPYITWEDVSTLLAAGHEFIDHGWSHSSEYNDLGYGYGSHPDLDNLTEAQILRELYESDQDFAEHSLAVPIHYAAPKYEVRWNKSLPIIMQFRRTMRGQNTTDSVLSKTVYGINWNIMFAPSYYAGAFDPLTAVQAEINNAIEIGAPVFVSTHGTDYTPNYFEQLLTWITSTKGLQVVTHGQLIQEVNNYRTTYYNLVKRNYEVIAHMGFAYQLGTKNGLVVFDCNYADLPVGVLEHYTNLGFDIAFWTDESAEAFAYMFPNNSLFLTNEPITWNPSVKYRFAIPGYANASKKFPASGSNREPITLSGITPPQGMSFGVTYYVQTDPDGISINFYDQITGGTRFQPTSGGSDVKITTSTTLRNAIYNYIPDLPAPADCTNLRCLKKVIKIKSVGSTSGNLKINGTPGGTIDDSNLHYFRKLQLSLLIKGGLSGAFTPRILNMEGAVASGQGTVLLLSNNFISGGIDYLMRALQYARSIDLSYNALAGPIPNDIKYLTHMQNINLNNNMLGGSIPDAMATMGQNLSGAQTMLVRFSNCGLNSYQAGAISILMLKAIRFDFSYNAITSQAQIDQIIADVLALCRAGGKTNGYLLLEGGTNAAPSAAGLANKSILNGTYGWTITNN